MRAGPVRSPPLPACCFSVPDPPLRASRVSSSGVAGEMRQASTHIFLEEFTDFFMVGFAFTPQ